MENVKLMTMHEYLTILINKIIKETKSQTERVGKENYGLEIG